MTTKKTKAEAVREPIIHRLLDHYGFSHAVLAQLVGVNRTRLRALTRGEKATTEEANAIALVQAFCALSTMPFRVTPLTVEPVDCGRDPAAWFECAIVPELAPLTPADIWAAGRRDLCAELNAADTREQKEKILDTFEPDWRDKYESDWEVVHPEDGGDPYIRLKANHNVVVRPS